MKAVQGFMSDDGNFFETEKEAEFHEAETLLMGLLGSTIKQGSTIERFMEISVQHRAAIRRYLNAYEAVNDTKNDGSAKEDDAPLLILPLDGHGTVPNVGSGSQSKTVQDDEPRYGLRGRSPDA